jgi:hypothetical protein
MQKRKISTAQSSDRSEHMVAFSAKHFCPEIIELTAVVDTEISTETSKRQWQAGALVVVHAAYF